MAENGPPGSPLRPAQQALLAAAFRRLVGSGEPAPVGYLASATGQSPQDAEARLDEMARAGRLERNADGDVSGALGLSLSPTNHAISIDGAVRHTWCALDAFGIMGALRASGWIESVNPVTGRKFRMDVEAGVPAGYDDSWVVFILERGNVSSVIDEWCTKVNIFEDASTAESWAGSQGLTGLCLNIQETASLGTELWVPRIAADQES